MWDHCQLPVSLLAVVECIAAGEAVYVNYVSGSGRNSGFRLRNSSVLDIFARSWFPVTVTVS